MALGMAGAGPDAFVLVVCGLPAAGKSSLCRFLTEAFRKGRLSGGQRSQKSPLSMTVRHVCFDAVYAAEVAGKGDTKADGEADQVLWDPVAWKKSRVVALNAVERAVVEAKRDAAGLKPPARRVTLVLADDNMYYRSMRGQVYAIAGRLRAGYACIHVVAEDTASLIQRDAARPTSSRVGRETINKMSALFEPPDAKRFHWEHLSTSIITSGSEGPPDWDKVVPWSWLWSVVADRDSVPPDTARAERVRADQAAQDRVRVATSATHQAGIRLRREVGALMGRFRSRVPKACGKGDIARASKRLSENLRRIRNQLAADVGRRGGGAPEAMQRTVTEFRDLGVRAVDAAAAALGETRNCDENSAIAGKNRDKPAPVER